MDTNALGDRFERTCVALGASNRATQREVMWRSLVARYSEPHRAYHTLVHLSEVFDLLAELGVAPENQPNLYFALFYHDAIYEVGPEVRDNEQKSAVLAHNAAQHLGYLRVHDLSELILLTKRHAPQSDLIRQLCADVDLGIFGASRERYVEYMAQIRREYEWVPRDAYQERRTRFLQRFLDERPFIYNNLAIRGRREALARENLRYEIETLRSC